MTMASVWFGITERDINDTTNLANDYQTNSFKIPLVENGYTPDADTHDFYADITNELTAGSGYTATGQTLDTVTFAVSSGFVVLDALDEAYTSMTKSLIRGLVVFNDTLASDPLILAQTFGSDQSVSGGTLTIQHDTNGIGRKDTIP